MATAGQVAATTTRPAPAGTERGRVRVAQVGTFDLENFGDLLFPLLARRALADRLPGVEIDLYSYQGRSRADWPFEVRPLGALATEIESYDLVLVGGGDIVRFDKEVAADYRPIDIGLHHPTSLWMAPTLLAAAHRIPVAWNAVGVPGDCPDWARPMTRSVLSTVNYLAVRDEGSAERLRSIDQEGEIHIAADTAFAVRELLPDEPSDAYRELLGSLRIAEPYVVVQPSPRLQPYAARLSESLRALHRDGWGILKLPIGPIHGDAADALDLSTETVTPPVWPSPELIVELVGRSAGAIGVSMHLAIAASALGVPVARPANLHATESKQAAIDRLPGVLLWPIDASAPISLPFRERPTTNGHRPEAQLAALHGHWDEVAAAAEDEGRIDGVLDLVMAVPEQLETTAGQSAEGIRLYRELLEQQGSLVDGLQRTLESEREDRERLRTQLAQRDEERRELIIERSARDAERTAWEAERTSWEAERTAWEAERGRARESLAELDRIVGQREREIAALSEERHRLNEMLQARGADRDRLAERLAKSEAAVAELAGASEAAELLRIQSAQQLELLQGVRADRARLGARLRGLEREHTELARTAAETEEWLRRLEGSRSWRLTTPLRAIAGKFRRTFRRERLEDEPPAQPG